LVRRAVNRCVTRVLVPVVAYRRAATRLREVGTAARRRLAGPAGLSARGMLPLCTHYSGSTQRMYDYYLGGKDNFAADREMGERTIAAYPAIPLSARAGRAFLVRVVEFLAGEVGIRQFLDIGTGLPTANNTHEVAQRVAPESRIVYVDNDPIVLSHAQALLTSSRAGACA
jgi:hypothetical protein